jgi:N-methylhydantoinase B
VSEMNDVETMSVDPIKVEVIRHQLQSATREMSTNLTRTAYSTIIYEINDFGLGLYDPKARLVAEATGITFFTRANDFALAGIVDFLGYDKIEEGDAIILNYPYWSSAHTLDVAICSPIFNSGTLVGFTAVRTHWLDLKQRDAGYCLDTTDMYQEGIVFPASKIYKRGELNEDVENIIRFNSRLPDRVIGDMHAQISACRIGEQRVSEIVDRYGVETYTAATEQIMGHGERLARQRLAQLPRGTWSAEDYMDGDGIDDRLVKMKATVTISEDEMVVDWTGSDPTTKGPINLPIGQTIGLTSVIFKALTTPETTANEGDFRPLRVIAPEGTLMHATPPAPTFTLWTGLLAGEVILKALAKGMPDLVPACSGGDVASMMGLGVIPESGRKWLEATNEGVGFGGHANGDGESGIMHLTEPGCRNNPVETLETKTPLFIDSYGLRPDSGGPGLHRGGLGVSRSYRFTADSTAAMLVYKTSTRPWGIGAGRSGDNCHVITNPGTEQERVAGGFYRAIKTGEVLVNNTGGGGGWGDAFERDPLAVLDDVREGYVTVEGARRDYGVEIDVVAWVIDEAATRRLREGSRAPEPAAIGAESVERRPLVTR